MKPFKDIEVLVFGCIIYDFLCSSTVYPELTQLENMDRYSGSLSGLPGNTQHVTLYLKPEMLLPESQAKCCKATSALLRKRYPTSPGFGCEQGIAKQVWVMRAQYPLRHPEGHLPLGQLLPHLQPPPLDHLDTEDGPVNKTLGCEWEKKKKQE